MKIKELLYEGSKGISKIVADMIEFESQVENDDHFHKVYDNYMDGNPDKDDKRLRGAVMAAYKRSTQNYQTSPQELAALRKADIN